ncbi:homeobox and leucine zipper encoding b [Sinocyclocheilus grahami]|uniref:Zinc fingers and homeoboxes protein 1-like n=1 Tax=Sinocyclocheilus grahami TaxID=75366 RepID=A0A672RZI2_SINGR|nr:PREDICTED: zinc fingers and homeoboxes protein 1-like [Sinocyclocheilus grahami]
MEQCAAPQLENTSTHSSPPDPAEKSGGDAGKMTVKDAYECRICGYKAQEVKCLSQHLHAAHPVTSLSDSVRSEGCESPEDERVGDVETPCLNGDLEKSVAKDKPVTTEGTESASLQTPEDSNETSSSVDPKEQEEKMDDSPAPEESQSSSPELPQEKSPCSSGTKESCQKRQTVSSGTSTHNQTNLVCLPLVSEGLKLIWVRSEQVHELDAVSELVEAFNAFPYPTSQEASALARKCALPPDRVKAWFMMQRVRYGISWADDDIQETRRKLWHIQKRAVAEECVEINDEEECLGREEPQHVFIPPPAAVAQVDQRDQTPKPSRTVPQPITSDQNRLHFSQNNASQSNNGIQQLLSTNVVYKNGIAPTSQVAQVNLQFQSDSRNLPPPHNTGVQLLNSFGHSSYNQHVAMSDPELPELSQSLHCLPGKKSKAQLMALRRSFVQKSWPSDGEVQRLQRMTGLNRRDIRKWFADSRYQLRRNGRAWLAKLAKRNRSLQLVQQNSPNELENDVLRSADFYDNDEADDTEAGIEIDVDLADDEGPVNQSNETKEVVSDEGELDDGSASVQQHSADISPSPSPSPSFIRGRVEPNVRLRKKTREQLEMLRQNFLRCQWPTSDDYVILQQKTGLTRTEIIQWYGDTRYHVKHNQMRWMTSEERERIIAVITQQQKRGGKYSRGRFSFENMGSGLSLADSTLINGGGGGEAATWNELFRGSTPVVPEGEL